MIPILTTIEIELSDDIAGEVTYEIDFEMAAAPTPARLSGPPEDCYPAEGAEFHIHKIRRKATYLWACGQSCGEKIHWYEVKAGEFDAIAEAAYDRFYDEMLDAAQTQGE